MSRPFFSIVIPTRNRAELLKHSVQSLLEQTFGDFEVIVSNNFSTDNTKEVVVGFGDERIRYVETPAPLEIGESFEFAASHADGEYTTFLSDDDACSIVTLEIIAETIENYKNNQLIVWSYCDYLLDSINQYGYQSKPNSVKIRSFDGKVSLKDSRETLKNRFAMCGLAAEPITEPDFKKYPGLINAAYHKSLFADVQKRGLNFFHPIHGANTGCAVNDLYSLVIALHATVEYVYLDYPLHLHGAWEKSSTTTIDGARKFYKASPEELLIPFKCYTNKAFAANAMLLAKRDIGKDLDYISVDWAGFFRAVYAEILDMKKVGVRVDEDIADFYDALERMPAAFQDETRPRLPTKFQTSKDKFVHDIKSLARPIYEKTRLNSVAGKIRKNNDNSSFTLDGRENGFGSILEFARKMDRKWLDEFELT